MKPSPPNEDHSARPGTIPLASRYTAGAAGQFFFDALKRQGKLIASRCHACKLVYLPAQTFCERCFAPLNQNLEVQPTGRIVSYTICYVDRDRAPLRRPRVLALVQLDGADTVLLHNLLGARDPERIEIGSQVKVRIKAKKKRIGSILDIEGFVLANEAPKAKRSNSAARGRRARRSRNKGVLSQ